jgi:hypothetical protein
MSIDLPKPIAPIFAAAAAAKMLPYSWAKQERRVGWSLNSCAAVWRAEWRETLDRARPIYRGIAPMPRTVAAGRPARLPRVCTAADQRFGSSPS